MFVFDEKIFFKSILKLETQIIVFKFYAQIIEIFSDIISMVLISFELKIRKSLCIFIFFKKISFLIICNSMKIKFSSIVSFFFFKYVKGFFKSHSMKIYYIYQYLVVYIVKLSISLKKR